ncbi:hypothetical protein V8G54_009023 [Vigna mungo]|uniref:Uncharacterized protein n=1 Tax=Vigna mungo TaxID=3915 RepID=A0AAQ3P486_VIGMU
MVAHFEEVLTIDEVFTTARRGSFITCTKDKPIVIYLEHWTYLEDLRAHGFDVPLDAHRCDIHRFFEWDSLILPKLIRQFLTNVELRKEDIVLNVLGQEMVVNTTIIADTINCPRVDNNYCDE